MTVKEKLKLGGIITAFAGGSLFIGNEVGKPECDYVIQYQQEEICISKELKEAIQSNLEPNQGFGGVKFNQE